MTPAEHNELSLLRGEVQRITVRNATLAAENRRLRRLTANGRAGRLLERTAADGKQLCAWRWAGFSVSRRSCEGYGMSRRRWHWAIALLERARVIAADARYVDDSFQLEDFADAVAAVERAVKVLETAGLASLEMRLPKNGNARPKRSR